ncbi:MAG TPA: energy transducer TonB [Pyrinomonadaceae bacterium]
MSKALTRLALALVAASLCVSVAAQETPARSPRTAPTPDWVVVSPRGEGFTARMPKEPLRLEQDVRAEELAASGRRYTATAEGGARYVVWALTDTRKIGERLKARNQLLGELRHLDLVAEIAWDFLVKPELERFEVERARTGIIKRFIPNMAIGRTFDLGGRPAREYTVSLEKEGGPVYVCADGARLYIVAALAPYPQTADSRRFVKSFALKTPAAVASSAAPVPSGLALPTEKDDRLIQLDPNLVKQDARSTANTGGGDAPVDYNRPFKQNEVTKKAVPVFKPEPGFTEWARRFNVTGVVRLRAILDKSGQMKGISIVKHLPHGLTEKAIAAARSIRFEPAQKDGQPVSQYVVLEYNFNIY